MHILYQTVHITFSYYQNRRATHTRYTASEHATVNYLKVTLLNIAGLFTVQCYSKFTYKLYAEITFKMVE